MNHCVDGYLLRVPGDVACRQRQEDDVTCKYGIDLVCLKSMPSPVLFCQEVSAYKVVAGQKSGLVVKWCGEDNNRPYKGDRSTKDDAQGSGIFHVKCQNGHGYDEEKLPGATGHSEIQRESEVHRRS